MGRYGSGIPGYVLSAVAVHASLLCGFTHDVGTIRATCSPAGLSNGCIPGCMGASVAARDVTHWCDTPAPCHGLGGECHGSSYPNWGHPRFSTPSCPWPPELLDKLMAAHEREIAGAKCECCQWSPDADDCSLYNELVFDAAVLTPEYTLANVEAVIFPASRGREVQRFAFDIQNAFKRNGGRDVPVLRYNALVDSTGPAFSLVTNH